MLPRDFVLILKDVQAWLCCPTCLSCVGHAYMFLLSASLFCQKRVIIKHSKAVTGHLFVISRYIAYAFKRGHSVFNSVSI